MIQQCFPSGPCRFQLTVWIGEVHVLIWAPGALISGTPVVIGAAGAWNGSLATVDQATCAVMLMGMMMVMMMCVTEAAPVNVA